MKKFHFLDKTYEIHKKRFFFFIKQGSQECFCTLYHLSTLILTARLTE